MKNNIKKYFFFSILNIFVLFSLHKKRGVEEEEEENSKKLIQPQLYFLLYKFIYLFLTNIIISLKKKFSLFCDHYFISNLKKKNENEKEIFF
jgi:hypothetical protein